MNTMGHIGKLIKALLLSLALSFSLKSAEETVASAANMNEGEHAKLYSFNLKKGNAVNQLEAFGKVVDNPVIFIEDELKGIELNALKGQMTLDKALVTLMKESILEVKLHEATGAIVVKVDPEKRESQSAVNSEKKNQIAITETENMKTNRTQVMQAIVSILTLGLLNDSTQIAAQQASSYEPEILELAAYTVTATRREENIQKVPLSVTAFDSLSLDDLRVSEIGDIARYTPGFTASSFNNSSPIFAIRGANNTFSQAGASKPVGVFVDDVFIPRNSASNFDLLDIEQITVLRGPQGTLFGRNVTGGAVQIDTVKPKIFENSFRSKLSAGNLGFFEAAGSLNIGINDESALRFSLGHKRRDGYITDRFNGREYNDINSTSARASYLFSSSENLEIVLRADYSRDDNNSRGYTLVSNSAGTDFSDNDGNIRTAEIDLPQEFERTIAGVSLKATLDTEYGDWVSISAYRQSDADEFYSLGAAAVALPSVSTQLIKNEADEPTSFSQELRFVSEEYEKFNFVAGFYYYHEDTDRLLNDVLLGVGGNATFFDRLYDVNALTDSIAGYLDGNIHLTDKLDLNIGGRYTHESKEVEVRYTDNRNAANNFVATPDNSFSEFTSRVALNWAATENFNVFVSRTEGFTAGGFNTETNSQTAIEIGFDPETVTSYEIGSKYVTSDNRFVLNISAFTEEFEDKQEGFFNPQERFFSIFNASEATSQGIELEASIAASENLTLHTTYAFLDTEYDSFVIPGGADFSGNQLQTAPENTFSVSAYYWRPLEELGILDINLGYSWQDEYFTGASNDPNFLIDSYGLLNLTIGLEFNNGRSTIKFWATNLADEEYVLIRGTSGAISEYYGAPRTYGVTLLWEF